MSEHLDLFGLLRGELVNAQAIRAGEHLEGCPQCQAELIDAVVGHALLTRAGRILGVAERSPEPPPLRLPSSPRRRRRTALLAVAAALVVGVSATAWWRASEPTGSVELTTLTGGTADGRVRMVEDDGRTRMTLAVHDLPRPTSGEFYYAWLLDPDTNKMLALGLVSPGHDVTFELDDALVASYSAIDVSLEDDDGDPAHSVTSVLRGTYQPDQITTMERKS